jgi:hypothetical protein
MGAESRSSLEALARARVWAVFADRSLRTTLMREFPRLAVMVHEP